MDDYSGVATGLGVGAIIFFVVMYFGTLALMIWIGYVIMWTAVKNGALKADEERLRRRLPQYPV